MDAFFASIEQRDFPELRGKPVAVGGSKDRGVVAAASYEARQYGVHSAMPSAIAYRKCPEIIFTQRRFDVYKSVSKQVMEIFKEFTDLVEPLSLDEAYLDVTENKMNLPSATLIAQAIKQRILEETQLTASAGVSFNKFLAKIASDVNKPNGLFVIVPEAAAAFIDTLPIEKFFGIGKVTAAKMKELGIHTGADLRQWERVDLVRNFGKAGGFYYKIVRSEDHRPVSPDRIRKSISAENTFDRDLEEAPIMLNKLEGITQEVIKRLENTETMGKTITLKLKYNDFTLQTRSKTLPHFTQGKDEIFKVVEELLQQEPVAKPVRLLGVGVSNLNTEVKRGKGYQLTLDF